MAIGAILISNQCKFQNKILYQGSRETLYNIEESVYLEAIVILNMSTSNNRSSKYMKENLMEMKREIERPTVTFGDFFD